MPKTWAEKFEGAKPAHIAVLEKPFAGLPIGTKLLISTPKAIAAYMSAVPAGETRTVETMRADLAKKAKADATCPMTVSIFARIAAETATDEMEAGKKPAAVTPFWRVIDPASPLAKKLRLGPDFIRAQRAVENPSGAKAEKTASAKKAAPKTAAAKKK